MADLQDIQAAQAVKLVGSEADGTEQTPVESTPNGDVLNADIVNHGGLDTVIPVGTTPVEGKVGATAKANRKIVVFQALGPRVKWGFSSTSQSFDAFNRQYFAIPLGENTSIWFRTTAGTINLAFGEIS